MDPAQYADKAMRLNKKAIAGLQQCTLIQKGFVPQKHNINTASSALLSSHPYLDAAQATAIVHYRETHGLFKTVADLLEYALLDEPTFTKVAPYLVVDPGDLYALSSGT